MWTCLLFDTIKVQPVTQGKSIEKKRKKEGQNQKSILGNSYIKGVRVQRKCEPEKDQLQREEDNQEDTGKQVR